MALRLSTDGKESDDPDGRKAELTEHLAELRTRIIRSVAYCAIGMAAMYALYHPVYRLLSDPILRALPNAKFIFTNFTEPFFLKLQISVVGGLIVAAPVVMLELWGFIAPGLTRAERSGVRLVAPMSIVLFAVGTACAFFVMPMAIRWFLSYMPDVPGAVLYQNPLTYIVFTIKMMLAFGLVFQLPVVLLFLGKVGFISSAQMVRYWRQITVGLFTGAMIVAPSNDIVTMLALAIPLTGLFLGSIWLVKLVEPKSIT
jgi:sec-independent protein translocase protein TatC